jgi:striatin 1/3/4
MLNLFILHRCLQEISYLTSPQAMNPLPSRPLLNSTSIPLALPNVPSFDQIAYHRPRKVLPETGKEFPLLNGHALVSGSSSAPLASGQHPPLERNNPLSSGSAQHQQTGSTSQPIPSHPQSSPTIPQDKEREAESEGRQLTAIFRPDDAGEWREKLRLSHEASEQVRSAREGQSGSLDGASAWDGHRDEEEDVKEEDVEVEDDEANVVGEGEGTKVWKAKRTLRKSVKLSVPNI